MKAEEKVPVKNKYVNEVEEGANVASVQDKAYIRQIVTEIN